MNTNIEKYLFDEMTKAMELKNELELQLLIAEQEYEKVQAAYRAYLGVQE